jgi:hypothetical protein
MSTELTFRNASSKNYHVGLYVNIRCPFLPTLWITNWRRHVTVIYIKICKKDAAIRDELGLKRMSICHLIHTNKKIFCLYNDLSSVLLFKEA